MVSWHCTLRPIFCALCWMLCSNLRLRFKLFVIVECRIHISLILIAVYSAQETMILMWSWLLCSQLAMMSSGLTKEGEKNPRVFELHILLVTRLCSIPPTPYHYSMVSLYPVVVSMGQFLMARQHTFRWGSFRHRLIRTLQRNLILRYWYCSVMDTMHEDVIVVHRQMILQSYHNSIFHPILWFIKQS